MKKYLGISVLFSVLFLLGIVSALAEEGSVVEKVFDNYEEVKGKVLERDVILPKEERLTHINHKLFDLTYQKKYDCDFFIKGLRETFNLGTQDYISISGIYCWQKKNEEGVFIAEKILINHVIESNGTEISTKILQEFVEKFTKYEIFEQEISYYPVVHLIKERGLSARHSFRPYHDVLNEVFYTKVPSVEVFYEEAKSFLKNVDYSDKKDYEKFIKEKVNSQKIDLWMSIFDLPRADAFAVFYIKVFALVKTDNGYEEIETQQILAEYNFADTRWDEFIDEEGIAIPENYVLDKICVEMNTMNIGHPDYPNLARNVFDIDDYFYVKHGGTYCFDYNKTYYLQQYFAGSGDYVWYGTTCRYLPYARHDGKRLNYDGEHGGYKCPVTPIE